jgi:hypothetical protein
MKKIPLYLLLGIVVFATGCPKYRPSVNFENENSFRGKLNAHLAAEQKRYQCFRDGMNYSDGEPPTCTGTVSDGSARAKAVRDELVFDALSYIDDAYGDFKNDLAAGRDKINFVADLVELGTSAAVGITKGERPLQILGIGLTAFRGGRRSADVNFYRDQSTPILISKMNGNRARVRALIMENKRKDIEAYPIGEALADVVEYYNAGTLIEAFTKLSEDTAVQTKRSEDDLRELKRRAGVLLAPTEEEIRVARENSSAMDTLIDAYDEADTNVNNAEAQLTDANNRIASATQRISTATQQVSNATQRLAEANAASPPVPADVAQATQEKAQAEAAKVQAEADKAKAETDKTAAEAAKAAATTARDTALGNLKGTYEAIEGDPALAPLLDKIPDLPGYSAAFKTTLQASLQRLKEKRGTVNDYALIILQVGKVARLNLSKDPTLNERLQTILKVNR